MLSQFLHLFSLNEIVDVSKIYAAGLSRVRGMTPANLNTFSNANRTRDPKVMQTFFWTVYDTFRNGEPDFIRGRHHGRLSKFRLRGIYAIGSTTIQLAYWCIGWAKHRQRKAPIRKRMPPFSGLMHRAPRHGATKRPIFGIRPSDRLSRLVNTNVAIAASTIVTGVGQCGLIAAKTGVSTSMCAR